MSSTAKTSSRLRTGSQGTKLRRGSVRKFVGLVGLGMLIPNVRISCPLHCETLDDGTRQRERERERASAAVAIFLAQVDPPLPFGGGARGRPCGPAVRSSRSVGWTSLRAGVGLSLTPKPQVRSFRPRWASRSPNLKSAPFL